MKKTKVMLADDHLIVRSSLGMLINKIEGFEIIAEAANGKEVIEFIEKGKVPQILILDLSMPVMDGYETVKILYQKYPQINILILTMYHTELIFLELLNMGVKGVLKKNILPSELEKALKLAANSQHYCSSDDINKIARAREKENLLTNTEIEFLRLSATDKTYKEIADTMNVSPRKIDHLRDHLFEKLDVKNRACLAVYAIKSGLVFL